MALLAKRQSNHVIDVDAIPLPRLADDPRYAAASEIASALARALDRLVLEKERVLLEEFLRAKGAPRLNSPDDMRQRARLAELRRLVPARPPAPPAAIATTDHPVAVAAGLAAAAGVVPAKPTPNERIAEIDRMLDVINTGHMEQLAIVDQIATELTVTYATALLPVWERLQVDLYRSAQEVSRATTRLQALRARIVRAGWKPTSVLLTPAVRGPLVIGAETEWNSEISGWRRILEGWGLL